MTRIALAALAIVATAIALRIRRDARAWAEWDIDSPETDEYAEMVPMTWSSPNAHTTTHHFGG